MWRSRKTLALVLLACLALGLRIAVVLALRTEHAAPVTYEHGRIAENLLAGRGFSIEFLGRSGPTSQQAPFYPLLLAVVYALAGGPTAAAMYAVWLLQSIAGTVLVLVVAWLGWSLFPGRPEIGWIAAIGAAVFPPHLYMVTHFQVALWAALVLTLLLCVASSPRWQGSWRGATLAGVLSGTLLLIEPILALVLPIVAAMFWIGRQPLAKKVIVSRRRLGQVALMTAVAAAVIAPWSIRNQLVHGQWIFVKSTLGYAFWQGNNPNSRGTDKIPKPSAEILRRSHDGTLAGIDKALWEARHETIYIDDLLLKPTGYRGLEGLNEPERCRVLGDRAKTFISAQPKRYAGLCLQRLAYFLTFDETNPKAAHPIYRLSTVLWLAVGGVGLVVSRHFWRRLLPTYAIFLVVVAFHSLTIFSARFRIPVEPMTMVWCAWAVAPWFSARSMAPSTGAPAANAPAHGPDHALRGPHFPSTHQLSRP